MTIESFLYCTGFTLMRAQLKRSQGIKRIGCQKRLDPIGGAYKHIELQQNGLTICINQVENKKGTLATKGRQSNATSLIKKIFQLVNIVHNNFSAFDIYVLFSFEIA